MATTITTGAIVFTDMVDSTALVSRIGDERADVLRRDHDELLRSITEAHSGAVLRWTGDGMKAGFPSASDAIAAAVDIQRAVARYAASESSVAAFQLRIGIGVGELSVDASGDQRGIAVIEAARLEALARPGEILVTDTVRVLGARRVGVGFEAIGERALKGLDLPVAVHRVVDLERAPMPAIPRMLVSDDRVPFVGRDVEIAQFVKQWDRARVGEPGVLFVRGPAGIGKTTFVSRCSELAHRSGALVLAGGCSSDVPVPYEPFAEAFRATAGLDPSVAAALDGHGPLGRLFPAEREQPSDAQLAGGRLELFDAVSDLVARLTVTQPLLLVLDDLHWATVPTVLLLGHLVEHVEHRRLQIVVTYRDGEIDPTHPMRDLVANVGERHPGGSRLGIADLGSFSERDVAGMVSAMVPSAPMTRVAEVAELVCAESAGLPFFAAELIAHLDATGRLDRPGEGDGVGRLTVPESLHDVVLQRLGRLPGPARDVLVRAAVLGPVFDVDLLAEVVEQRPDDVLDVLEEVERRGLLTEAGIGRYGFVHAIVRTALVEEVSTSRRARIHRRVAEVLEARGADQFDELARHWQLAGEEGRAAQYLARAGRRDMASFEFESARARFRQLVDQYARDPHASVVERADAWLGLAAALRALGDHGCVDAVGRAAKLARSVRDARLIGEAATLSSWLGVWFYTSEKREEGFIELCEDALTLLDAGDPMRVRVLATLASHLTASPDPEPRRRLIEEASALAAQHDDPTLTGTVLYTEFTCLWEPSTLDRREQIARSLGRVARATGDDAMGFVGRYLTIFCSIERGELAGVRDALTSLRADVSSSRRRYNLFLVDRLQIALDILQCSPGVGSRVDALVAEFSDQELDAQTSWMLQTGLLAYQAGTFGEFVNAAQAMTSGPQAHLWTAAAALALLWSGDPDAAEPLLDQYSSPAQNYFWVLVTQAYADVAVGVGRRDHGRRMLDDLMPYRGRIGVSGSGSGCFGLVSRTLGMLASFLGEHDLAIDLLVEAVDQAIRIAAPFELVACRRQLAEAQLACGRLDQVMASIGDAVEIAERHGFARELAMLRAITVS